MGGLLKDQTERVLSEVSSRVFTIVRYNAGVYIPPTARCDNASGIGKNAALTQKDRLSFFSLFSVFSYVLIETVQSENMR